MDFARVIDAVADFLERENVPFALVGAFALHAFGVLLRVPGIDEDEVRGYFERAGMEDRYIELKRSL